LHIKTESSCPAPIENKTLPSFPHNLSSLSAHTLILEPTTLVAVLSNP